MRVTGQLCLKKIQPYSAPKKEMGRGEGVGFGPALGREMESGRFGFFFVAERLLPAFPACSEVGQRKKVHGRDFWCGQLGVWKDGETEGETGQGGMRLL